MAGFGARFPVVATRTVASDGTVTYSNGVAIGKLIKESVAPVEAAAALYGDDGIAEEVNDVLRATISTNVTNVPEAVEALIFGATYTEAGESASASLVYKDTDDRAYVGHGFIAVELVNGERRYVVNWLPKCRFTLPSEEVNTKGQSVTLTSPTLSGTAYVEDSGGEWREKYIFTGTGAASAAVSKLKTLAGISEG